MIWTFRSQRTTAPPKITFYSTETGESLYSNASYNARDASAYWHPSLALCAVVVSSEAKGRLESSLVVYDLRDGRVGSYNVQHAKGQVIRSCSWDPVSVKESPKDRSHPEEVVFLAVVVAFSSGLQIQLFRVGPTSCDRVSAYSTLGTWVFFSPAGRFAVADDTEGGGVIVQFYDMRNQAGVIKSLEIDGVEVIQWDPAGVFVMTSSARTTGRTSGFKIWLLDGNQVLQCQSHGFKKCMWRPHPSVDLTPEEIEAVKVTAKDEFAKYGRFGVVDAKVREEEQRQQKISKMEKWKNFRARVPQHSDAREMHTFTIQLLVPEGDVGPDVSSDIGE
jgi:hypothetical protein